MANSPEYVAHVMDLLAPLGAVVARPMFGGHGFFLDGTMFAKMGGDRFQLRVDDRNRAEFETAGMERVGRMPYYHTPPEVLAEEEEFVTWARGAVAASRRAKAAGKTKPAGKPAGKK